MIVTNHDFETAYQQKIYKLLQGDSIDRGPAHAMKDDTTAKVYELMHVAEAFKVDLHASAWQETIKPNLPWAEDHFQERVSGQPLNPAPSEAWWPFARQGNAEHKKNKKFSHTYPERFWPKQAGIPPVSSDLSLWGGAMNVGIRFEYGDLDDLVEILKKNPRSRQAYLPIWFPEDLAAAEQGERVPCSLGYHFIYNSLTQELDCVYTMRSCDIVRFYRDDVYMAGRLLQNVAYYTTMTPGALLVNISNLHCFEGDRPFLEGLLPQGQIDLGGTIVPNRNRANYNFEGLF